MVEDELPNDAVVVRGGLMARNGLERAARNCFGAHGFYGLSLRCIPGMTAAEIARNTPSDKLPHPWIRSSTVGEIRASGYEIRATFEPGHASLMFPGPPTDDDWETVESLFGPPQDNPAAKEERDA